jgi:hypothetical protein
MNNRITQIWKPTGLGMTWECNGGETGIRGFFLPNRYAFSILIFVLTFSIFITFSQNSKTILEQFPSWISRCTPRYTPMSSPGLLVSISVLSGCSSIAKNRRFCLRLCEMVRNLSKRLKGTNFGIGPHYPPEVLEKRKKWIPVMLKQRQENKKAYIVGDKLFVNGTLWKELYFVS